MSKRDGKPFAGMESSPNAARRRLLGAGAGLAAAALSWPLLGENVDDETGGVRVGPVVLLHGAWHGGWVWRPVADRLRALGYETHAPSLTGLGARRHLADIAVNLSTHVDDLVGLVKSEEMRGATVVAHSYAGMVATAAVARLREHLAGLIYLDAFIPADGDSMLTWTDEALLAGSLQAADQGRFLPPPPAALFGIDPADAEHTAWLERRLNPHPLATLFERAKVDENALRALPRTAILCTQPVFNPAMPRHLADRFDDPGYRLQELAAPHNAMVTNPDETAERIHRAILDHGGQAT